MAKIAGFILSWRENGASPTKIVAVACQPEVQVTVTWDAQDSHVSSTRKGLLKWRGPQNPPEDTVKMVLDYP